MRCRKDHIVILVSLSLAAVASAACSDLPTRERAASRDGTVISGKLTTTITFYRDGKAQTFHGKARHFRTKIKHGRAQLTPGTATASVNAEFAMPCETSNCYEGSSEASSSSQSFPDYMASTYNSLATSPDSDLTAAYDSAQGGQLQVFVSDAATDLVQDGTFSHTDSLGQVNNYEVMSSSTDGAPPDTQTVFRNGKLLGKILYNWTATTGGWLLTGAAVTAYGIDGAALATTRFSTSDYLVAEAPLDEKIMLAAADAAATVLGTLSRTFGPSVAYAGCTSTYIALAVSVIGLAASALTLNVPGAVTTAASTVASAYAVGECEESAAENARLQKRLERLEQRVDSMNNGS